MKTSVKKSVDMAKLRVKVTAHKHYLLIETIDGKKDKNFVPFGGGQIGCVLIETDNLLGMSKEAAELLKTLKKSGDDIGDVSTWKTGNSKNCFAWIGNLKRIIDMTEAEGDNKGIVDIEHVTIENDVPPEALDIINNRYNKAKS